LRAYTAAPKTKKRFSHEKPGAGAARNPFSLRKHETIETSADLVSSLTLLFRNFILSCFRDKKIYAAREEFDGL